MAQYIRTPIQDMNEMMANVRQVSQVVYHDQRVIEIDWDYQGRRVVVQDNGDWFYLTSPDINNITMYQVMMALGYHNQQIVVTWADNNEEGNVLNSTVENAPLNQMALYPPNQPIPAQHAVGPFPAVAGQPVPDANANAAPDHDENDDANSELSDMPPRIVDTFGDSDDERRYD